MICRTHLLSSLVVLLLAAPAAVSAATVSLTATPANIGAGDTVRVDILLDSIVPANAFSGTLSYTDTLEPVAVSDGNSVINLWITRPAVSSAGAPIQFAGITPGGFSGTNGLLFAVVFRATAAGTADISPGDVHVLRNDGAGGEEPVILKALELPVGPKSSVGYVEPSDNVPPESFTAHLGNDPQLFGRRNYLVFMTVDKNSGVDHYLVAESRIPPLLRSLFPLSWKTVVSPYPLADQHFTSTVYIRAVDRAGNERLSTFPPRYFLRIYEKVALLVILLGATLLWQRRRERRSEHNP